MNNIDLYLVIFTPFLLMLSAFASSSETSLFSLDRFQLKKLKDRHKKSYENIKTLLEHPTRLLIIIITLNEIANLSISNLVTGFIEANVHPQNMTDDRKDLIITFLSLAISMPLTLIFGEITPKIIAARLNRFVAALNSRLLILLYRVSFPFLWLMDQVIYSVLRGLKNKGKGHLAKFTNPLDEQDFVALIEEAHKEGSLNQQEKRLIQKVFRLDDIICAQVMKPIHKVFLLNESDKIQTSITTIKEEKYSRIPVYSRHKKNIVGLLYVKDLLSRREELNKEGQIIKPFMAKPMYVTPQTNLSALLRKFKSTKVHMAIVTDRNAQAMGIITLEDVLEAIFGDIEDERDIIEEPVS